MKKSKAPKSSECSPGKAILITLVVFVIIIATFIALN